MRRKLNGGVSEYVHVRAGGSAAWSVRCGMCEKSMAPGVVNAVVIRPQDHIHGRSCRMQEGVQVSRTNRRERA